MQFRIKVDFSFHPVPFLRLAIAGEDLEYEVKEEARSIPWPGFCDAYFHLSPLGLGRFRAFWNGRDRINSPIQGLPRDDPDLSAGMRQRFGE
jgi:hypothetical protein